ncbi:MAG: plasmid replication initiator TrfA [Candidatus Sedimenticola sp. (ex Thyasira tokunagai)]
MSKIFAKLSRLKKTVEEKQVETPQQLPIWPEPFRSTPNEILRSNLFTSRTRGERENLKGRVLAIIGEGVLAYTGEELRTDDEDVWLQILHLAKEQPLSTTVEFTPYAMVKALGWVKPSKKTGKLTRPGKAHYERLKASLTRMQATALVATLPRLDKGVSISLIDGFQWEGVTPWRVVISPEVKKLFGCKHYTSLQWTQRLKLTPTAKRIHGYFSSHTKPYPIKIEKLYALCSSGSPLKIFKNRIGSWMDELVAVGFLKSWEQKGAAIYVKRS